MSRSLTAAISTMGKFLAIPRYAPLMAPQPMTPTFTLSMNSLTSEKARETVGRAARDHRRNSRTTTVAAHVMRSDRSPRARAAREAYLHLHCLRAPDRSREAVRRRDERGLRHWRWQRRAASAVAPGWCTLRRQNQRC